MASSSFLCGSRSSSSNRVVLLRFLHRPRLLPQPTPFSLPHLHLRSLAVTPRKAFDDAHLLRSLNTQILRWTKAETVTKLCLQILPDDLPEPFELEDRAGTSDVTVRRTFNDEEISISCFLDADYPESDDDEENPNGGNKNDKPSLQHSLYMRARITKGIDKRSVEIVCCYEKDASVDILIEEVSYIGDDKPQHSPPFQEMEPNLQKAFVDVLKERGINAKLGDYLIGYLINKYHSEYIRWLQKLQSFVVKR